MLNSNQKTKRGVLMNDTTIGQFLSSLRKSKGYTQQNVADALNVSNKTVSGWERDVSIPDANFIPLLAELYGVSCDEILKGRKDSPVPYDLRTDEVSSRLFISTYSAQKTMNAIAWTVIASLFLVGGYITSVLLSGHGGTAYVLSLPFTAIALAITLTGYFTTYYTLRLNGKEFILLRRKILNITRGALLAEVASPFVLLPIMFSSDNAVNTALFCIGFALLTVVPLLLVDNIIRYCNNDLYVRDSKSKRNLIASAAVVAVTLCALTVCLPVIYEYKYVDNKELLESTNTTYESYDELVKALKFDPLEKYALTKTFLTPEDHRVACVYTFPKEANISEMLDPYTEYTLYRLKDCDKLYMIYNVRTIRSKTVSDDTTETVIENVAVTAPQYLYMSYVDTSDGNYRIVSPLDYVFASERASDSTDFTAALVTCAAGVLTLCVYLPIALKKDKKSSDQKTA